MSDPNEDALRLHPETVKTLDAILRTPHALRPATAPISDTEALVRYLCGVLPAEQAREVEQGLKASAQARQRLRTTNTTLRELQALPWGAVKQVAAAEDAVDQVAQVWLKVASEQSDALAGVRAEIRTPVWEALVRKVQESLAEATAFRTAFAAFVAQVQLGRQMAGALPSATKGRQSGGALVAGEYPANVEFKISGIIVADGTLQASLTVQDAQARPDLTLEGQTAHLALDADGTLLSMASAVIAQGQAHWQVPAVGQVLGLPAGALPPAFFHITLGESATDLESAERFLLAEVVDADGNTLAEQTARLELPETPRVQNQQLQITLAIDPVARIAYSSARLALEIPIGGQRWQTLAAWPLAEWTDAPRSLMVDYPGSVTEESAFLLPFRVRLYLP